MLRREFLAAIAAFSTHKTWAQETLTPAGQNKTIPLGAPRDFNMSEITERAQALANRPYKTRRSVNKDWLDIDYDTYRSIWFDNTKSPWQEEEDTPLRFDVFAPGLYFPYPVDLNVIENGQVRKVEFDLDVFNHTDKFPDLQIDDTLGYSGLRLRAELEKKGIYQEFAVFQGASYFRGIGTGDTYGLSARGLAINVAEPSGEEFPDFTAMWLEKPQAGDQHVIVHALLDTPSCTGAYRFDIRAGQPLHMDICATIFPRTKMEHVGIAPLTSMFQFDETNRDKFSDFRPAVHDSDGLLINNGAGETLWRPLANPRNLQISAFVDEDPKGFGLMQRARKFSDFADLEAHYHKRPNLWVEPQESWGKGSVVLVEIPTDREIYDNIVAYWRPEAPLQVGENYKFNYSLRWGAQDDYGQGLRAINTRIGKAFEDGIIIAVDFENAFELPDDLSEIEWIVQASAGRATQGIIQRNPETKGARLAFKFFPEGANLIEFRVQLRLNEKPLSETWLYRWTA